MPELHHLPPVTRSKSPCLKRAWQRLIGAWGFEGTNILDEDRWYTLGVARFSAALVLFPRAP